MTILITILVIAFAAVFAYTLYKSDKTSKEKAEEVKDQQVNPAEKVPGLEYDTTEVDPTKR